MAKTNGTGQGGKSFQDRELAARVRTLTLLEIEKVLKQPKHKLYGPVLVKLAGSVLPRLNEHTGENGEPMKITFDSALSHVFSSSSSSNSGVES